MELVNLRAISFWVVFVGLVVSSIQASFSCERDLFFFFSPCSGGTGALMSLGPAESKRWCARQLFSFTLILIPLTNLKQTRIDQGGDMCALMCVARAVAMREPR